MYVQKWSVGCGANEKEVNGAASNDQGAFLDFRSFHYPLSDITC